MTVALSTWVVRAYDELPKGHLYHEKVVKKARHIGELYEIAQYYV